MHHFVQKFRSSRTKTYFYFIYLLFKTPHIRLSILHYISLKYHFFLNCLSFFTYNNYHSLSSFILEIRKEITNNKMQNAKCNINSVSINLYGYCSKLVNLHNYMQTNMGHFKAKLCKFYSFFLLYMDECEWSNIHRKCILALILIRQLIE